MIDRRTVISGVLSLIGATTAARARTSDRLRRVGILMPYPESDSEVQERVAEFRQELRKLGWAEGQNLKIDERWATDNMDRVRAYAAELINLEPDVIFIAGRRVVPVVQQQTRTIPTVAIGVSDPAGQELVANGARSGGNLTGFGLFAYTIIGKSLEILKEIAPGIARAALICHPDNPATADISRLFKDAAEALAIEPAVLLVHQPADIERAIGDFARAPNGAMVFPPDLTLSNHRQLIIALAARHHLPAFYFGRIMVRSGGLISYGAVLGDLYRHAAFYVDRILRGEKPGDLPVQQPTRYELVINLKTAKALGLTIPPSILLRADEVIE